MPDIKETKTSLLRRHIRAMVVRDSQEEHRASTPLELLFDLVSVIAIAAATAGFHHSVIENHIGSGLMLFVMAFFAIWWAWMQFTWFASGYDNDDIVYRFAVFVMLAGSLCLAAGIEAMFASQDFTLVMIGYVVMRVAHVGLFWRASNHNQEYKKSSRYLALGILLCQIAWVAGYFIVPPEKMPIFYFAMVAIELSIPAAVSYIDEIPAHNEHIAERYGLLTIIVLGESLLSLTWNLQKMVVVGVDHLAIGINIMAGLVSMLTMWWIYFGEKKFHAHEKVATLYQWGYGHVLVFAGVATFGGGLAVNLDFITHKAHISQIVANASLAIPAAGFLLGVWFVHERFNTPGSARHFVFPGLAVGMIASAFVPFSPIIISMLLVLAAVLKSHFENQVSG